MTRGEIGRARGDGEAGEQTRKIIRERERGEGRGGEKVEEGRVETRKIDERSGE